MPKTVNPVASPEGMRTLSVTEAVRNFADLVNRAFYQGAHFRLTRGGRAVAELWPPSGCLPPLLYNFCSGAKTSRALGYSRATPGSRHGTTPFWHDPQSRGRYSPTSRKSLLRISRVAEARHTPPTPLGSEHSPTSIPSRSQRMVFLCLLLGHLASFFAAACTNVRFRRCITTHC